MLDLTWLASSLLSTECKRERTSAFIIDSIHTTSFCFCFFVFSLAHIKFKPIVSFASHVSFSLSFWMWRKVNFSFESIRTSIDVRPIFTSFIFLFTYLCISWSSKTIRLSFTFVVWVYELQVISWWRSALMIDNRIYFYVMNESKWQTKTHSQTCVWKKSSDESRWRRRRGQGAQRKEKHEWIKGTHKKPHANRIENVYCGSKSLSFYRTVCCHWYIHTHFEYIFTLLLLYGLFICVLYGSFIWP